MQTKDVQFSEYFHCLLLNRLVLSCPFPFAVGWKQYLGKTQKEGTALRLFYCKEKGESSLPGAPMLLKKSIGKTKDFFQKSLKELKSFLLDVYQNLPQPVVLNSLSRDHHLKNNQLDDIRTKLSCQQEPNHQDDTEIAKKSTMSLKSSNSNCGSGRSVKISDEKTVKEKQDTRKNEARRGDGSFKSGNGGSNVLAQKMQELKMMDMGDVNHSLDVEEALHYYSRLTSPVYQGIVDKFFVDMYTDYLLPQSSISLNSSSRRLNSSRRLTPLVM
ncbi:hypothetical protein Nepgr_005518 [Nepenthes gracilis]|uniref:Uncharacterized protein n=1 Tax=Nepenthes gracilis TaxID=150966 RepID=A0AAD3S3C1_NEPGR|nr:hypothetical protein Nepgr_005518 [Nepenthes gracilis]